MAIYKLPLVLEPQPEGGYTATCPLLPELITEGDTVQEALENASDALAAIVEAYEDLHRPLPAVLKQAITDAPLWVETAVMAPLAKVCTRRDLDDQGNDLAYWRSQPYQDRLMALEEIRQEYHRWRYGAEPGLQGVYTILRTCA